MPLGIEVGLGPGDFVLDGYPAPSPKRGRSPSPPKKYSVHVYCGQTAGWIKMVLGMGVGPSPDDFVLYGDPAPLNLWPIWIIVIVISLEHCTVVIGLFKFKF